jgi:hypothetical protein
MKIELKKIRVYERMSEETTAFTADVHINGKNVGTAENGGKGGETQLNFYHVKDSPLRKLCDEAEAWAKTLPDRVITDFKEPFSIKVDLTLLIDEQVEEFLKQKEIAKREKAGLKQIQWGKQGGCVYNVISWKGLTLADLVKRPNGLQTLQSTVNRVKKEMPAGEQFLNAEHLMSLGVML